MSAALFKKLEQFRKAQRLSVVALCRKLDTHTISYYRWKKTQNISGAYRRLIGDFLQKGGVASTSLAPISSVSCPIAVIGMSCYYPGASNIKELWENILARRIQFRRMLDQRLPLSEYYDLDAKAPEKTYLTKAAFLENFVFDWGRLRIPKKTVESTDIVHWLALDIALRTFEDAGYKLNEIPQTNTGVIVGNTLTGEQTRSQSLRLRWPFVQKVFHTTASHLGMDLQERNRWTAQMEPIYKSAFFPITEDSLAGGLANTIAGRICNYLNLKGGGYIVDGACSSSLLAVATAADSLKMGYSDLILAGGVDVSLDPFELVGFAKAGALARDKMSVYDQSANGFLPGEGCGFVLLKRLSDAIRDKNYVYAVVKGWGISSDGKGGIMEPSSTGQSLAIGRAYKNLDYKISDVDFVEGHGTGTTKGDRVELEGINTAIEQSLDSKSNHQRTCGITSFKSIVGHTKAAAGVGGLIKAVLAVNQRILPPTASCQTPNEVFKDKARHLYPLIQGKILDPKTKARAGISSAGFGGINCHITVESKDDPKKELKTKIDERALFASPQQSEVFVFTSRNIIHLKKMIDRFKKDLRNVSIAEMADLAAFLNKKVKRPLPIKAAIITDSPEHLYDALVLLQVQINEGFPKVGEVHPIKSNDPNTRIMISHGVKQCRVAFLYPGQGSQRLNMTRMLNQRFQWARDLLDLSKKPLFNYLYKFVEKVLNQEEAQEFEKQLADTQIAQPAIVASSLMWTEFLSKLGVEPTGVAGHSLGELAAFYKAGVLSQETLVGFADLRGQLMAAEGRQAGGMVSLACAKQKADEIVAKVSGNLMVANINSPSQTIVSGGKKEIEKTIELCQKEEIRTRALNVSNAFHSSFMESASNKIKSSKVLPEGQRKIGLDIYLSDEIKKAGDKVNLREYFSKQVISPVNFIEIVESIAKKCDVLIEVGPGRVLTDLAKTILKGHMGPLCLPIESSAQNDRDLNVLLAELFVRNVDVKWEELYKNRLIRVFVPASRKKFIENQCEGPLRIGNQILKSEFSPLTSSGTAIIPEKEEIISGGLPQGMKGKDSIAELLIDLTHQITGFDKESITLNSRLLDDLNLDSIKAAELIGQASRKLGLAGIVDPSKLSNNTLAEIRDKLDGLVTLAQAGLREESVSDIFKRSGHKPWVRNFVVSAKPEEIVTKNVNQLKDIKRVVLLSDEHEPLSESIEKALKANKAKIQRVHYDAKKGKTGEVDCLMVILPREKTSDGFNEDSLKDIIRKMRKMVDLVYANQMNKNAFVVVVEFGGGIASSCGRSIVSTLYLERADLKVRIIEFDPKVSDKEIAPRIMDELQTYERFNSIAYDDKLKRQVVYYENSQPSQYKKRNIVWSQKDVVLVTGGAKGITAQCALEFARFSKAHMILIGRSPLPSVIASEAKVLIPDTRSSSQSFKPDEIIQTLKQFEKEHLKASYYQCDVTNEKDVVSVIKKVEQAHGKITGFIHGAGLNSLKRLKQAGVQEAFEESLPKVMGAVNVCKALSHSLPLVGRVGEGETSLKLIVGITSIIGVTGMEGSGWYGLANEVLNLYLHGSFPPPLVGRAREGGKKPEVVTIAYSIWDEIGMGTKLGSIDRLAERGITAIPVEEGVKRFRDLVEGDAGVQQVIVAARLAGLDTWKTPRVKTNQFRFIDEIKYLLPDVELIAQAQLNVQDDPYLLDHNWKGSLLFPFVFGFEAMAQAVACVLGMDAFESITAKDINLARPISVPEETGTKIEIHALVLEQEKNDKVKKVKVEIYSQESAYQEPHFSAVFEIGPSVIASAPSGVIARSEATKQSIQEPKQTLDIDPQTDLYGPILFQGKMFQCIEKIHELYYDEKTKKGECVFSLSHFQLLEIFLKNNKKYSQEFLVGNPFFLDTLFQAMQVVITPNMSLPNHIEEINLSMYGYQEIRVVAYTKVERVGDALFNGNTIASNVNGFFVEIKNCKLKVLEYLEEKPNANDLVDPTQRDQAIIENKIDELAQQMGFVVPTVRYLYDSRLKKSSREERHKIEIPLIQSTVCELLRRENKKPRSVKVGWLKSGRPVLLGKELNHIKISLSHCDNSLVCVSGYGEQGCDIENIVKRSEGDWLALLGLRKFSIQKSLIDLGLDLDFSGTVVWSAFEAFKKLLKKSNVDFQIVDYYKNRIIFKNIDDVVKVNICSISMEVIHGPVKIFSFSINVVKEHGDIEKKNDVDIKTLRKIGFNGDQLFGVNLDYSGPQKQLVLTQRFPVTFKTNQMLSRRVYFTNFFDWIGTIREYSIYPIFKKFAKLAETGEWGMVTNMTELEILGGIKSNDVVEAKIWGEHLEGNKEATTPMFYEWYRITDGGRRERVAVARQKSTWVNVRKDRSVKIERMPKFLHEYLTLMNPITKESFPRESCPQPYRNITLGNKIKSYSGDIIHKIKLNEGVFSTTLENANLVGNIYFANYAKWLGAVGDRFFYNLVPSYFLNVVDKNEIICLECNIYYLNDAFPFENIHAEMYLDEIYENGLKLYFEFYRIKEGKKETKLAYANQKVIFAHWSNEIEPDVLKIPDQVRKFIKSKEAI